MSALGHSRPGPASRRSSHVRYAPKATVGHQNAIGRDVPQADSRVAATSAVIGFSTARQVTGAVSTQPLQAKPMQGDGQLSSGQLP
jgi:hypothetical protein